MTFRTSLVLALWLSLPNCFSENVESHTENAPDYQKLADSTKWRWDEESASPLSSIRQSFSEYDITVTNHHETSSSLSYQILRDDQEVYSWLGHFHTVFRIVEDRLYYALYHPSSSGGMIVAVDLTTGQELWSSRLTGLGPVAHSAYRNLIDLNANEEVVTIYGNEAYGRYFEVKDAQTGETVGHKIFPKDQSANQ